MYDNSHDAARPQKNVILNTDTNAKIHAENLSTNAKIGVYVLDNYLNGHGKAGTPFGTYDNNSIQNLNAFVNDRERGINDPNALPAGYFDGYMHGIDGESSLIYWPDFIARVTADDPESDSAKWSYHTWLNHN